MIRNFYRQFNHSGAEARRGIMRSTLFAGAMLLVSCRGGVEADNVDTSVAASGRFISIAALTASTTSKPTTTAATAAPSFLGINIAQPTYYSGEHQFQNLLVGRFWVTPGIAGWPEADPALFDHSGNILRIPTGGLNKILAPPVSVLQGSTATIRCTWTGTGLVRAGGEKSGDVAGDHSVEFKWVGRKGGDIVWLEVATMSATDPVRNLDCREKGAPATLFSSEFISSLKPFGVIRFMDWMSTNSGAKVTWATRTLPEDLVQTNARGVALEHIIALTNQVGADAWVNVAWNADADYIQRMAQLLHDGVPAGRKVYIELSNEVWNPGFVAQHQAEDEGVAENLAPGDRYKASQLRYAEKTIEVMKVWTRVFADRPGQLVRVVASQNDNPWTGETIMAFRDTANWVDALSTAPYFGHYLSQGALAGVTDADKLFPAINQIALDVIRVDAARTQATAKQYGKRFIAYEAGQHITGQEAEAGINIRLNRDQRMYDVYRAYIAAWKAQVGDTMVLYNNTGPFWGLREYSGQPLDQTPKLRAALDAIAGK